MSTGKENQNKKATVLKMVSGKQPLHDSTSAILNRPPVEPEPSQSTSEAAIHVDEDAVLDPLACADNSPPSSPGYLDDLFEKLTDSETLGEKLNRVLDNQKALFSLVSKLMGDVAQNSRDLAQVSSKVQQISRDVQIARTGGLGLGFSAARGQGGTPDLSLVSGLGFSGGRGQGGIGQQESTPVGRGQSGIGQQKSTPVGRGQDGISQQANTPAGSGEGGINLECTPDLSLGSGIDFSVGSEIQDLSLERELEPFNSSCNEHNQSQSGEDYLQSNGREGEDVFLREAMKIKLGSCSVGNFAVRLVQTIFLQEELVNRNCRGSRGKQGLNPSKLAFCKGIYF